MAQILLRPGMEIAALNVDQLKTAVLKLKWIGLADEAADLARMASPVAVDGAKRSWLQKAPDA